jgi:hypothetical protein
MRIPGASIPVYAQVNRCALSAIGVSTSGWSSVAPILKGEGVAEIDNSLKVPGVPRCDWDTPPRGASGDNGISPSNGLAGANELGKDFGGQPVILFGGQDLFVKPEERFGFCELLLGVFDIKSRQHFDNAHASETQNPFSPQVVCGVCENDLVPLFEDFGKDVGIQNNLRH